MISVPIIKTNNYNKTIAQNESFIDRTIKDYNYEVIDKDNKDQNIFYSIVVYEDSLDFKKYITDNMVDITIPHNKQFIISMHSNETIAYKWEFDYSNDNFELIDKYFFTPSTKQIVSEEILIGWSERRENFRFMASRKGSSVIEAKLISSDNKTTYKTLKLNITVK